MTGLQGITTETKALPTCHTTIEVASDPEEVIEEATVATTTISREGPTHPKNLGNMATTVGHLSINTITGLLMRDHLTAILMTIGLSQEASHRTVPTDSTEEMIEAVSRLNLTAPAVASTAPTITLLAAGVTPEATAEETKTTRIGAEAVSD